MSLKNLGVFFRRNKFYTMSKILFFSLFVHSRLAAQYSTCARYKNVKPIQQNKKFFFDFHNFFLFLFLFPMLV